MELPIAIAQFRPQKADLQANLALLEHVLADAVQLDPRPELVIFPETALSGYFLEGGVRHNACSADSVFSSLEGIHARVWDETPLDVVIGFYELGDQRVYNSALYAELGGLNPGVRHVHRKVFLPTYGVFQEERFVESGSGIRAFDTRWGRAGMLICEDVWHSISGALAAMDGAEVVLVPSASPARGARPGQGVPLNVARWDNLVGLMAAEHGFFVAVSQLVGFEGGKGFAGGSTVHSPHGQRMVRGPLWSDALIPVVLETEELVAARVEEPLLADLERNWARLLLHSPGARILDGPPAPAESGDPAE